jgi:fructokinase
VDPLSRVWKALANPHVVKVSRDEFAFLAHRDGEDAVIARLFAQAARLLLVTDGAAPIAWWTRSGSGTAPTFAVDTIDTTAAGDAFVAGLLQGLATRGIDAAGLAPVFDDAATRGALLGEAAACGALATTRFGAFAAMPSRAEVDALLERGA